MKVCICDKLTSSVNDVKCSNALGFFVTKFWPNLICLGKQRKMGKQKQPSKRKEYAIQL